MILYKSLYRTLKDGTQLHTEAFSGLFHFGVKGVGNRTYEVDGQPWAAILLDIANEKVNKAFNQQAVYLGHVAVLGEEGGEAGQETIGQRLAVDSFKYDFLGEFIFGKELVANGFG